MGISEVVRNGWHPEKNSEGKESWLHDNRGVRQVKGWAGRDQEKNHTRQAHEHVSKPISSLQDPASFGAPPKHKDYYGDEAASASIPASTSAPTPASSAATSATLHHSSSRPGPAVPSRIGTGATVDRPKRSESPAPEELPSGPFRADTTGLSTANLPPPPVHRDRRVAEAAPGKPSPLNRSHLSTPAQSPPVQARPTPPPVPSRDATARPPAPPVKPKPSLPPRSAVAGGLQRDGEIEENPPPPYTERPEQPHPGAAGAAAAVAASSATAPAVSELQARFAQMRANRESDGNAAAEAGEGGRPVPSDSGAAPPPVPLGTKPK